MTLSVSVVCGRVGVTVGDCAPVFVSHFFGLVMPGWRWVLRTPRWGRLYFFVGRCIGDCAVGMNTVAENTQDYFAPCAHSSLNST